MRNPKTPLALANWFLLLDPDHTTKSTEDSKIAFTEFRGTSAVKEFYSDNSRELRKMCLELKMQVLPRRGSVFPSAGGYPKVLRGRFLM